ncbi:DUF1289 domain-containing protein [Novosphingobium sp. AAP83]|uniref:DUF1289 domain-containing protein n=1 Tax=Novosphingobium sp. AAP83 TaxID=1523425 RepID=UPI0009E75185|nr:DUF1289 domain-containing protein [Novosphingobium sp. AAP83]
MSAGTLPSPCIDVCIFERANGWCTGCGRTKPECSKWRTMPRREQQALLATLRKRLRALSDQTSRSVS